MQTLRENSWPSYMVVKNSIQTCTEGHSSWRWTTSPQDDQPKESHSGPCMTPENAPPSAAVWPGHKVLARQRNASGRCPQLPPIQNQHWNQVRSPSQCHIDVLPSPQDVSPRLQQRPNGTPSSRWCRLTLNSWPDRQGRVPRAARFYWSFHDKLSIDGNLLTKGECVVIPPSCRDNIMADLHGSHASINKAMDLARTCVYWPGMEADITDYIKQCLTCIECSNLPVETLQPHEVPPGPWVKIGVDFFQDHLGKKHLIVADYFSKFPYMFPVASTHHFKTITNLRELFAAEGVAAIVMSDNGPPFNGEEFRQFFHDFNFVHTTSSPHFHQSNGFIEAMVKKSQKRLQEDGQIPQCSGQSITPAMWHTHHGRPSVPSRDSTWLSSSRHSPFKTIQKGQHTSDLTKTRFPRKTKRTVQQSP